MTTNEYIPNGCRSWHEYYKKTEASEKFWGTLWAWFGLFLILAAYAVVGYIERM